MQDAVRSVIRPDLADGFYLDFDSRQINWEAWHDLYTQTCISRQLRNSPRLESPKISGKVEILLSLAETFAVRMAQTGDYLGNVELQLVLHSLICIRFEPHGESLGDAIMPLILEITESQRDKMSVDDIEDMELIMNKFAARFKHMQTPVIEGKLVYRPGIIMGIDAATNW